MSYVHIGLYNTLRSLGATEDQAQAAVADLPMPHHMASKEVRPLVVTVLHRTR